MPDRLPLLESLLLVPVLGGCLYGALSLLAAHRLLRPAAAPPEPPGPTWPPVTILKPVCGLEKNLEDNLRTACRLDYPDYQVVLSVQRPDDPALPLLRALEAEFGAARVTVSVTDSEPVVNGKIQNLSAALKAARHDILLISDSDIRLRPDYLKQIVAPFQDPKIGFVCTLYRGADAERWFEKLELLSYNTEFVVNVIFAKVTGASDFCLGCSVAMQRAALEGIGGFDPLGEYLVEDYELGRRITALGYRSVLVPYFVDTTIDIRRPLDWWNHQVYWDQNTRAARPIGYFFTVLIRPIPFALLFALARGFDAIGLGVLGAASAVRLATALGIMRRMGDPEGPRALAWLPLRDLVGLGSWAVALVKRTFVWRDLRFGLTREGRIVPRSS